MPIWKVLPNTPKIFPKQIKLSDKSVGNWINLPYYDADNKKQVALHNSKELSLNDALTLIKKKQTSLPEIEEFMSDLLFKDAPPCLQMLYILNPLEDSGRNNYLFSFYYVLFMKRGNRS